MKETERNENVKKIVKIGQKLTEILQICPVWGNLSLQRAFENVVILNLVGHLGF